MVQDCSAFTSVRIRDIQRSPVSNGFEYKILFYDDRPEGYVLLYFFPVTFYRDGGISDMVGISDSEWDHRPINELYTVLIGNGLKPDDTVANLNQFKPNGRQLTEDQMKRLTGEGVGSYMLERVIEDSLAHDARAMETLAITDSMRAFAGKKEFTLHKDRRYYKIL